MENGYVVPMGDKLDLHVNVIGIHHHSDSTIDLKFGTKVENLVNGAFWYREGHIEKLKMHGDFWGRDQKGIWGKFEIVRG